jgi:hypothetical protein
MLMNVALHLFGLGRAHPFSDTLEVPARQLSTLRLPAEPTEMPVADRETVA